MLLRRKVGVRMVINADEWRLHCRFVRERKFDQMQKAIGLGMKGKHTIVEKWAMKLRYSSPSAHAGAQEEFDLLQSSGHSVSERYVEWKWT